MIDAQQELDDEILSACHDGELPPTEAEAVRRRLAREPDLAERLYAIRYVDGAAAGAFRALDRQPLPARTLELLHAAEAEHRERRLESTNVVPLRQPITSRRSRLFRWPAAIAASVALGVGFAAGALLPDDLRSAGIGVGQHACEQGPASRPGVP
jgi:anti-sigma factor RsiW